MTDYDRKMIELAATAAGYEIARWTDEGDALLLVGVQRPWNPLTNDGDALRLWVKLSIKFVYTRNAPPEMKLPRECAVAVTPSGKYFAEVCRDEVEATRRAIVRAAAEIGRAAIDKKEPQ